MRKKIFLTGLILIISLGFFNNFEGEVFAAEESSLQQLLPELNLWKQNEDPQIYFAENLYEYINGAAEIYLAYEFKELVVTEYGREGSEANVTVEIYDMGTNKNSFGIYSAERYSDNRFIPIGLQGYVEEGVLNFLVDNYYIKLLCFECTDQSEEILKSFAQKIVDNVGQNGVWPVPISAFPKEGKIINSEKYLLQNFLGYGFLHDGYVANFKVGDLEFDCFIIEGKTNNEADIMLKKFLEAKKQGEVNASSPYILIKDRYYKNIYLARYDNYIIGVMKIDDEQKNIGLKYLKTIIQNLKAN